MKVLIDQDLPVLLADWLCERGHEAEHVRRLGLDRQDDHVILAAAQERGAVVISKDGDFAGGGAGKPLVTVIWVRIGKHHQPRTDRCLGESMARRASGVARR